MHKIVFLCSGNGGNLKFIHEAINLGILKNSQICAVITDRDCNANRYAHNNNIESIILDFALENQLNLLRKLKEINPCIIITTVHRILSSTIIKEFEGSLINLHYSILPSFGKLIGTKPVTQALDYGSQFIGTTVHYVDTLVDEGKPLMQTIIPVVNNDTIENLMDIVFRCGCISLLNSIMMILEYKSTHADVCYNILKIHERTILLNPVVIDCQVTHDNFTWEKLNNPP